MGYMGRSGGPDRGNGKMTWSEAFILQARSDYAIFKSLGGSPDTPECHRLHYLQMATEKLTKYHACLGTRGAPKNPIALWFPYCASFRICPRSGTPWATQAMRQQMSMLKMERLQSAPVPSDRVNPVANRAACEAVSYDPIQS